MQGLNSVRGTKSAEFAGFLGMGGLYLRADAA
jgi:hypothetical protein